MGIGSWFKKWRRSEDEAKVDRAREEFFDTPEEQRMQAADMPAIQADRQAGMLMRDSEMFEHQGGSADAEERLDQEGER